MSGKMVYISDTPPSASMEMFADEPDLLNTHRVAELCGVADSTIWREVNRGKLKATHVGRCVRITKKALIEYLEGDGDEL